MCTCVNINETDAICPKSKNCPEAAECMHSNVHLEADLCTIECPEVFPEVKEAE